MEKTWYEFDGNENCDESCRGWDGLSNRCDCGNRRVYWECMKSDCSCSTIPSTANCEHSFPMAD